MIITDKKLLDNLTAQAKQSSRRRMNFNFHHGDEDILQRMLNALEPDTYVRPHKHENPGKNEVFIILRGRILVLEYNDDGSIHDYIILDTAAKNYTAEIPPGRYHSMISLDSGTVAYEIKKGPYLPDTVKKFAPWSPAEGSPETEAFIQRILDLTIANPENKNH